MDKYEVAMHLTIKAMEQKTLHFIYQGSSTPTNELKADANKFNAEQAVKYFNTVLHSLGSQPE